MPLPSRHSNCHSDQSQLPADPQSLQAGVLWRSNDATSAQRGAAVLFARRSVAPLADWVRRFKLQPGRQSVDYNSVAGHVGLPETNASAGFAQGRNEQRQVPRKSGFISPPPTVAKRGGEKPNIWAARSQASAHELIMRQHDSA